MVVLLLMMLHENLFPIDALKNAGKVGIQRYAPESVALILDLITTITDSRLKRWGTLKFLLV